MYHKLSGGFVALFVLFLSGCSTVESRIQTLFHMRYPTRPSFSKEVFALDGSTCAIEKGVAPVDISLT